MPERLPESAVDGWQLVQYDEAHWKGKRPPPTPPSDAEAASDPCWSSLYVEHRIVATWFRQIPMSQRDLNEMGRRTENARARRR